MSPKNDPTAKKTKRSATKAGTAAPKPVVQRSVTSAQAKQVFVYIVNKPGHDLHDEDTLVEAANREEADQIAAKREKAWDGTLRFVGKRENGRYVFTVPRSTLPEWAREDSPGVVFEEG